MTLEAVPTTTAPPRSALTPLLDACVREDRVAPLSGHILAEWSTPSPTRYLSVESDGSLIGVAVLPDGDPAELAVHPAHRRRGIGRSLLAAVLETGDRVWAHGDLPAARALAGSAGLRQVRELIQMRRALRPSPELVVLPEDVSIRTFVVGQDEDAFLAVNARAFAWHPEQGRLDRAGLALEMAQSWFDPAGFFLAVDAAGTVLGYHWTKIHRRDETPGDGEAVPIGEIYVIGVDPQSPVRRLGAPLSVVGLNYLRDRGMQRAMLYVEGDNEAALRLYRRLGFSPYLTDVVWAR